MALIANEPLYIGFTLAANVGNVVSPEAVKEYGWQDKVTDDGGPEPGADADTSNAKGRASKGGKAAS